MKILRNKTYKGLLQEIRIYRNMYEDTLQISSEIITELMRVAINQVEITRQEMIINIKETKKFKGEK